MDDDTTVGGARRDEMEVGQDQEYVQEQELELEEQANAQDELEDKKLSKPKSRSRNRVSNSVGIRPRIQLVCNECKKQKVMCDKMKPACSACRKRGVEHKCQYTKQATERIDLTSVHNEVKGLEGRISDLETSLSEVKARGASRSTQSTGWNFFTGRSVPIPRIARNSSGSMRATNVDIFSEFFMDQLRISHSKEECFLELEGTDKKVLGGDHVISAIKEACFPSDRVASESHDMLHTGSNENSSVTSAMLSRLPGFSLREKIFSRLEECQKAGRFPCFHLKAFRNRVEQMLWKSGNGTTFTTAPSSAASNDKGKGVDDEPLSNLSLYSAACAALAIGSQYLLEEKSKASWSSTTSRSGSDRASVGPPSSASSSSGTLGTIDEPELTEKLPTDLYTCSRWATFLHCEENGQCALDHDHIYALLLQSYYLLSSCGSSPEVPIDRKSKRQKRPSSQSFDTLSIGLHCALPRLVNALIADALSIGLNVDPDYAGHFSLFEKEIRRRLWWEIVLLDKFISELRGMNPTLRDDEFTTNLPTVVDDEKFGVDSIALTEVSDDVACSLGYFVRRCGFYWLVSRIETQASQLDEGDSGNFEKLVNDANRWLDNLPACYRLSKEELAANTSPKSSISTTNGRNISRRRTSANKDERCLKLQKCELAVQFYHLLVSLHAPFLRPSNDEGSEANFSMGSRMLPYAIKLIRAARMAHWTCGTSLAIPALSYNSLRAVFHAGVSLTTIYSREEVWQRNPKSIESIEMALMHLKHAPYCADGSTEIACNLLETLLTLATSNDDIEATKTGAKRKIEETDQVHLDTVRLPFIGGKVSLRSNTSDNPISDTTLSSSHNDQTKSSSSLSSTEKANAGEVQMTFIIDSGNSQAHQFSSLAIESGPSTSGSQETVQPKRKPERPKVRPRVLAGKAQMMQKVRVNSKGFDSQDTSTSASAPSTSSTSETSRKTTPGQQQPHYPEGGTVPRIQAINQNHIPPVAPPSSEPASSNGPSSPVHAQSPSYQAELYNSQSPISASPAYNMHPPQTVPVPVTSPQVAQVPFADPAYLHLSSIPPQNTSYLYHPQGGYRGFTQVQPQSTPQAIGYQTPTSMDSFTQDYNASHVAQQRQNVIMAQSSQYNNTVETPNVNAQFQQQPVYQGQGQTGQDPPQVQQNYPTSYYPWSS